jgi:hypothetical protein
MLFAVREQLVHHLVVTSQCHQLVHTSLDVCTSNQFLQFLTRIGNGAQDFDLNADVLVLLYLSI